MKVEKVAIDTLIPDPANVRKHSEKNIEAIKGSLAVFGQQKPIVVNQKNVVIAGNGTLEAARALGWSEINVVRSELQGSQATAFAIADNRTTDLSEFDHGSLAQQLTSLKTDGFDLDSLGFDKEDMLELDLLINDLGDQDDEKIEQKELTADQKKHLKHAWDDLIASWKKRIDYLTEHNDIALFQDTNKHTFIINFLNFIYTGKEFNRYNSFAYNPHQIFVSGDGDGGGLYDIIAKTSYENNLSDRLRFSLQDKPSLQKTLSTSMGMSRHKIPLDFPAKLARDLINKYCKDGDSVLDPCHGWGGRLVGFLASRAAKYTGIDCSPQTSAAVLQIANDCGKYTDKKTTLARSKFEDYTTQEKFNFALTSPPYFDRERYLGDEQSHKLYSDYDHWRDGFYTTLINKVYDMLVNNSHFCLQVGSQKYPLLADGKKIAARAGFTIIGVDHTGMVGAQDKSENEDGEVILVLKKN